MQISRRNALVGAGAAVVAGVPMSAVARANQAGSDARILALIEEHGRTFAEMNDARERWCEAVSEKMPSHLRHVDILGSGPPRIIRRDAWDAAVEAFAYPGVKSLETERNRLKERCRELVGRLSQTEATTLEGVCAKMRFATRPRYGIHDDIVCSAAVDLERLAGEARP